MLPLLCCAPARPGPGLRAGEGPGLGAAGAPSCAVPPHGTARPGIRGPARGSGFGARGSGRSGPRRAAPAPGRSAALQCRPRAAGGAPAAGQSLSGLPNAVWNTEPAELCHALSSFPIGNFLQGIQLAFYIRKKKLKCFQKILHLCGLRVSLGI